MSYGGLWGAIQTPFMTPAQTQLSTVGTASPISISANANQSKAYFSTIGAQIPVQGSLLPIGPMITPANPRFSTFSTTTTPPFLSNGQLLPLGIAASPIRPYFTM